MDDLTLKEAFEIYAKNRDVILQMWSFYSGATLAVLGFTVGSDKLTRKKEEVIVITTGYIAFTIGNAWAVVSSQYELQRMAQGLGKMSAADPFAAYFIAEPISPMAFVVFYAVVAAFVSVAIWRKYRQQRDLRK